MNDETTIVYNNDQFETVVGDEKQPEFYPRVKVKRWDNEVNFSMGLIGNDGDFEVNDDTVTYTKDNVQAIFEPTKQKDLDTETIRYVYADGVNPCKISALYELNREVEWNRQTVVGYHSNKPTLIYYGHYPRSKYIDSEKLDIDDCRLSTWQTEGNPMFVDENLLWICVYYDINDDSQKIHESMKNTVINVLNKYGVNNIVEDDNKLKLHFINQNNEKVKFLSLDVGNGLYYFYINLDTDYNASHNYYRDDVKPDTKDKLAYGLRQEFTLPSTKDLCDEIIQDYATAYGANLVTESFTTEEESVLTKYEQILSDRNWVENAERTDPYYATAWDKYKEGFLFDILITEKPSSNLIPLTIKYKKLRFLKQEKVNEENNWQEPRVINSYAVYHEENKSNNEYQTGKAFHIYRPWVEDANEHRVWCDLEIDETNEIANIIIPQDFIDNATYPIYIDPTMGYTSAGASSSNISGNIIGSVFAAGGFEVSSITAYISWAGAVSYTYKFGIYDNSNNTIQPQTTPLSGATINFTGWSTLNTNDSSTYVMDNAIIVGWATLTGYSPTMLFYYDTDASVGYRIESSAYTGTFPSPVTWDTSTTGRKYSIYATITNNPRTINLSDGTSQKRGVRIWQ
jgi:lipoate-protein ligase A